MDAKTYVFSRYSGVGSVGILNKADKEIRDVWTKSGFIDQWGINRRYVRNAIADAIGNIKTMWVAIKKDIKSEVSKNKLLTDDQRHYIHYILKVDSLLQAVLTHSSYDMPEIFSNLRGVRNLNRYICRLVRKYKHNISKARSNTMMIDNEMYSYKNGYFQIMGLEKNKRLSFKVNTNQEFKGTIRVNPEDTRVTISMPIDMKIKQPKDRKEKSVGIDKNYINAIETSNNNSFGEGLNKIQMKFTDEITKKNKERQIYHTKIKENPSLKQKFEKNNLGKIKYNKKKNRLLEELRKCINSGINQFILVENPSEIIKEALKFSTKKKKNRSGRSNQLLGNWLKGELDERIEYKAAQNSIKIEDINPAYTSQECSICHDFGQRRNDIFYCNSGCEGVKSGFNSASNTLSRKDDPDITIRTPYTEVKQILQKRLADKKINRVNQDPHGHESDGSELRNT